MILRNNALYDVVGIGEVLIDFTPNGNGKMGNPCFEMNPGGGVANCIFASARLGGKSAFIGKVGEDYFGNYLTQYLSNNSVTTTGIVKTNVACTTLAFVSLDENGEREFTFYRKPGADFLLEEKEVDYSIINQSKILHFSSVVLSGQPARTTIKEVVNKAKKQGVLISYDPNYREHIWKGRQKEGLSIIAQYLEFSDILKLSDDEFSILYGDVEKEVYRVMEQFIINGKKAVFVTCGPKGAYYMTGQEHGFEEGFHVRAMGTTGCGDAFTGTIHYMLCKEPAHTMRQMVQYANAAGAICASSMGGMPSMPGRQSLDEFIIKQQLNTN